MAGLSFTESFCQYKESEGVREPLYSEIFSDDLSVVAYLDVYLLFKHAHKLGNSKKEEYPFVSYAKFHIMAMLKQLSILNVGDFEANEQKYMNIMNAIQALVVRAQRGKNFKGYGAFFNQPSLLGKIAAEYQVQYG
jgi:hypothetical protein